MHKAALAAAGSDFAKVEAHRAGTPLAQAAHSATWLVWSQMLAQASMQCTFDGSLKIPPADMPWHACAEEHAVAGQPQPVIAYRIAFLRESQHPLGCPHQLPSHLFNDCPCTGFVAV